MAGGSKPTCECGSCATCKNRALQRGYYADPVKRAKKNERAAAFRARHAERIREQQREYRSRPDVRRRDNELRRERKRMEREQKQELGLVVPRVFRPHENDLKREAYWIVRRAKQEGLIQQEPCESCGSAAEAHHDDYTKPLEVRWLCRRHHAELHQALRREELERRTAA